MTGAALGLILCGCGRVNYDALPGADGDASPSGCSLSAPQLVSGVSTADSEFSPTITPDGLQLYFHASGRPGGLGSDDIYRATRIGSASFDSGTLVPELSTTGPEGAPDLSPDGLTVYWSSNRAGGVGGNDIWTATRPNLGASFGPAENLTTVNSTESETGPAISADGLDLFFSSRRPGGPGSVNVWTASRPSTALDFGAPVLFGVVNIGDAEGSLTMSEDGLTILFDSRLAGGRANLYMTTRADRNASFSPPELVSELNSAESDYSPDFARGDTEIYFTSNRDGGAGFDDIYVSARSCL
jgi:Tol biopolymer transport system component